MKRLITAPARYGKYVTDKYNILFGMLKDEFGFEVIFSNDLVVSSDTEILIAAHPHNWPVNAINYITNLPKSIKVLGYLTDINAYRSPIKNIANFLSRCDVIISANNNYFRKRWPNYSDQFIHFPNCFAPNERYVSCGFNESPVYKCLLFGRYNKQYYPIRQHVFDNGDRNRIRVIKHPGGTPISGPGIYIGDEFAKLINEYFCAVTASSIYGGTISKYFEIPAAGALLANEVPDLKSLGFVPGEHYVAVTKKNVLDKIYGCLDNPEKYKKIRRDGSLYVRSNHSILNRYKQLKKIIKGL